MQNSSCTEFYSPPGGDIAIAIQPVLIVGAGPTGLTAAMELSRLGVPVRIVDTLLERSTTSRALAVQARTLELFEQRGLSDEMLRIGNRATSATIYGDRGRLGGIRFSRLKSRFDFILLISQAETERILTDQVLSQGVRIERGTSMTAFTCREDGVDATLQHPDGTLEEVDASYLIDAEGSHSSIRRSLALPFDGMSFNQSYAVADLQLDGELAEDELSIFTGEKGFLAVFPLGGRRFRLVASEGADRSAAFEPDLATLQSLYDSASPVPGRLHDLLWSSLFRINSRMLATLKSGRVFIGGDAAHVHSPAGGQGMNTGIQDMINLCWKLSLVIGGDAGPDILETYQAERLPIIRKVVRTTERATRVLNSTRAVVHRAIARVAPIALGFGALQNAGTGIIGEISANYRSSALSVTGRTGAGLVAGDRLPDLDISTPDSSETRLFELLDPSLFTLLVSGSSSSRGGADDAALDPWRSMLTIRTVSPALFDDAATNRFDAAFGTAEAYLLVRPDSYLACVVPSVAHVVEWFTRWAPGAGVPKTIGS